MAMQQRDPDAAIVALFRHHAIKNEVKTRAEGRPIYDDMEVVEIRFPGSRAMSVFPATAFSHWQNDFQTGEQTAITYAERFQRQYQQFKAQTAQTKSGTPLAEAPFLTEARRAELRAQNIYTVEQLAVIDGAELKNLGTNGRELKNAAIEYMARSKATAPSAQMAEELAQLRARNAILEEDAKILNDHSGEISGTGEHPRMPEDADLTFDDMSIEQLREFITANSGHAPHGSIGRKTLIRMASDVQKQKA